MMALAIAAAVFATAAMAANIVLLVRIRRHGRRLGDAADRVSRLEVDAARRHVVGEMTGRGR